MAKSNAGGGEAVDHSSERPFHGSPVASRIAARWTMLTQSSAIWQAMPIRITTDPTAAIISQGRHSGTS
jgi:hypothetical protein